MSEATNMIQLHQRLERCSRPYLIGIGLPETNLEHPGLGIRIMGHRAAMIGGSFAIEPALGGGTIVTCSIPKSPRHEPVSA